MELCRAVWHQEMLFQRVQQLWTKVELASEDRKSRHGRDLVEKNSVRRTIDKNINFVRIFERRRYIQNESTKLEKILKEIPVLFHREVSLARVIDNEKRRLRMEARMDHGNNLKKSRVTISCVNSNLARQVAIGREQVRFGQVLVDDKRHLTNRNVQILRKVVVRVVTNGEATCATMVRAVAQERMYIDSMIHHMASEDGEPLSKASKGVIGARDVNAEESIVIERALDE